ncbi:MerR family transcriptional regulator [Myceligenerans salitolerans]|uniref:MerR family transcriptional regulator n=2 Tax=Myceligenerans salitolerans TaxID=1230528 RepID=A0ABS3I7J7_9MICO|nr:MerR family transcriptional regulator [Myceligenerans salitolerans]
MMSIGAFAQIGQVTHRMLRHWDQSGLLTPAHIDEFNGSRSYDPSQLPRLHRIVALRQLGFGLEDISAILAEGIETDRLATLLRRRRAELDREHALATVRLSDVERRLRFIEKEKTMSSIEIITKDLPAVRLAARTITVPVQQTELPGVVGPAFEEIGKILTAEHGRGKLERPIAIYEEVEDGTKAVVGYAYDGDALDGFDIVELPAVPDAACTVHLGPMKGVKDTWLALHAEMAERGWSPSAPCRELYIRAEREDQSDWVTELQQPVTRE